jgi:hypothetical protein
MYDTGKIVPGLVVFALLMTTPIWYSLATGGASKVPEPQLPANEDRCVESTQWMRDNHMQLLEDWRQMVVREGLHTYTASDGTEYAISLTDTCLSCHSDKAAFCDTCHEYTGVSPNCWECHNVPEGN